MSLLHNDEAMRLMNRICQHQVTKFAHPLTCGNNSNHPPLFPVAALSAKPGKARWRITLVCAHCDYEQRVIPSGFLERPTNPTAPSPKPRI